MSNPTTLGLNAPDRPILSSGQDALQRHLDAIPAGKNKALIIGVKKNGWMPPTLQFGVAARLNTVMSVAAEFEAKANQRPSMEFYTAFAWK